MLVITDNRGVFEYATQGISLMISIHSRLLGSVKPVLFLLLETFFCNLFLSWLRHVLLFLLRRFSFFSDFVLPKCLLAESIIIFWNSSYICLIFFLSLMILTEFTTASGVQFRIHSWIFPWSWPFYTLPIYILSFIQIAKGRWFEDPICSIDLVPGFTCYTDKLKRLFILFGGQWMFATQVHCSFPNLTLIV